MVQVNFLYLNLSSSRKENDKIITIVYINLANTAEAKDMGAPELFLDLKQLN